MCKYSHVSVTVCHLSWWDYVYQLTYNLSARRIGQGGDGLLY